MTPEQSARLEALPDDPMDCEDLGRQHEWTDWEIGPHFPREERFCMGCGIMEWQSLEGMQ